MNRDSRAHRSRSPLESSRRHNTTRGSPTSPRRRGRQVKDIGKYEPTEHDGGHATHKDIRHVHFTKEDQGSLRKITGPRSRSPAKRMADFNEELLYASDERKVRMERIAEEWAAYNQVTPPIV